MLFDVVEERRAQVEVPVASWLKLVEGEVEEQKRGFKVLNDDVHERLGKLQQYALDSILDSALSGYTSSLKEWARKTTASVVYDSNVCPFTAECLFQMVRGRPNISIVATTTDGDVFGAFYSVAVTEQDTVFYDPNMFIFSFESHGRCATPRCFFVKEWLKNDAYVCFWKNCSSWFVELGVYRAGEFFLGNEMCDSYCWKISNVFEGLKDTTLTGVSGSWDEDGPHHHCSRLVAFQLW